MAYTKTNWLDRAVQHPNRFTLVDNGDGTVTIAPAPGTVTQTGTPISATNLNKMEQGIADAIEKYGGTITNANTLITDGFYNVGDTWTGSPFPGSSGSNQGYLEHHEWQGNTDPLHRYAYQIHTEVNAGKRRRYRIKDDGVWQPWIELWTTGNINPVSKNGDTVNGPLGVNGILSVRSPVNTDKVFEIEFDNAADSTKFWSVHSGNAYKPIEVNASALRFRPNSGTTAFDVWHMGWLRWNAAGYMEYNDGGTWRPLGGMKNVQRGETAVGVNGNTDVTINPVVMNKSVFHAFVVSSDGNENVDKNLTGKLLNSNTIRFTASGPSNVVFNVNWQVAEYY